METKLQDLENYVNALWTEAMGSDMILHLPLHKTYQDKALVAIYLTQVYHYAVHTPRHQALVGVNMNNTNFKYMQYCFEHALEETGHELMALKDINALGYPITEENMPPQLPSTQLLIAFLYKEAQSKHPIHHLGYGFWSENACPFINEFMQSLMAAMQLGKNQMTFYSSHVTIDEHHASEVREIIKQVAKTDDDWKGMKRVAKISFDLTVGIIKDTFNVYNELRQNQNNDFSIFK